ncbi:MAG: FKBP-type peptidyl-prolyl cis-trans isomerase [Bacteroidales bacterium]|nr:FKBP-type peptidyl-prolyl cis-trans isomerase [Bacteroidales bacterium]MBR4095175.1 FKBP-type peptidyl-prolyl cis-trans isomerase [Bacteroidales bacterium]
MDSVSYAVGVSFGGMLKQSNMENLNFSQINKAMHDLLDGKELKISEEMVGQVINAYMIKAQVAIGKMKEEEQANFLAENGTKDGVNTTESGLQYKIEVPGNNEIMASPEDTVEVHYTGTLLDGTVFDSSVERGESVKFPLNAVIKGWTEGMQLIGEGGKIKLWIPYELGYGPRAMGPNLPGYSTLVFDVELIKVYKAASAETEEK